MNLLEYQAKSLLETAGIPTPRSLLIKTKKDLSRIHEGMYPSGYVVKAQIAAGARGKAGGIKIVATASEAKVAAAALLGATLATGQTRGEAIKIVSVLVTEKIDIVRELYVACALDRRRCQGTFVASSSGGMSIEEVAKETPELIAREPIDPWEGIAIHRLLDVARERLKLPATLVVPFAQLAKKLASLFTQKDLMLLEINPLAQSKDGFVALDAKVTLDENALFRHPDFVPFDKTLIKLSSALERKAKALGISYIPIGGEIGCLVNGAGLAMATMDLIGANHKKPANFLDVGGSADLKQVQGAFELLLKNRALKAILVNIFGGIMRCDIIAQALVEADKKTPLQVPLVARLQGSKMEEAHQILKQSQLSPVYLYADLDSAIDKVCELCPS